MDIMKIIGIHDDHNASTDYYLVDRKIKMVLEEERITRIKKYSGFPKNAINIIFSTYNNRFKDIYYVSLKGNYMLFPANREETKNRYREGCTLKGDSIRLLKKEYFVL
jgi:predicted NodU family carbamoyl transferase